MNFCLEEYIDYLKRFTQGQDCLSYKDYEINYIEMNENIKEISIEDNETIEISGNNIDGIIITKRKNTIEKNRFR